MNLASLQALFLVVIALFCVARRNARIKERSVWIYYVFLFSGFPALLYQIVWQRALFTLYGVNVESVTMIVTVFMLGLGLGSLLGGRLSSLPKIRPLVAFGAIEISIGLFGAVSLWIFHRVGALTAGHSTFVTGAVAFGLLLIPTLLMGSTLPLLVEHVVRTTGNVGESVGSLYAVNTFGSGVACPRCRRRSDGRTRRIRCRQSCMLLQPNSGRVSRGNRNSHRLCDRRQDIRGVEAFEPDDSSLDWSASRWSNWLHRARLRDHLVPRLLLYDGR
jgi:hypothetical protein